MSSQTNLHEEGLSANQSHVLAGVLNHSSDLVSRVVAAHRTSGLLEDESDVTPKFFRAVNETVGKRRLFVCCDGTWVNASGTTAPLTNVARFARAIDRFGLNPDYPASPVTQVIYYSAGIGSESVLKTRVDSIYSGITGAGLEEDILNAYCFLCNNYNFGAQNDEIILIGFSRGAFTVRCLADFISQVGLLQRKTLPFLSVLFQRWMDAKEEADRETMKAEIRKMQQTFSVPVKITVLAEWDTVSAIGHVGWRKKFSFMKDTVPENVQNAFLAIALNERRGSFKPMVYTKARRGTNVTQCVFCGCHSDIGGGNLDAGLSTVSLLWMAAKIQRLCRASFHFGALLQMVQPPRPNAKWWYGRKVDETAAMNLLWSKGNINESLQGVWYIPHILTLGWSSGVRRRHFRKTFKRQEHIEKHEHNEPDARYNRQPMRASAKLYKANYDYEKSDDVSKMIGEDVIGKIKEGITRAGRGSPTGDVELPLTATVKTAIHIRDTDSNEANVTAVIDATFKAHPDNDQAAKYQQNMAQASDAVNSVVAQDNEIRPENIGCDLKVHFTVKELIKDLGYRAKEGALEGFCEKLGWLGHERSQLVEYLPQESYDETEKKLWEEWKSQVDLWHTSNEGRKGGWDKDVKYWSDVLARFEKGGDPESLTRKDMVQWELRTDQLCQVADAAVATAQAGLKMTVANVAEAANELESAARTVTRVAEMSNVLQGSEDDTMKRLWSTMDEVKGAFGRLPGEMLAGSLANLLAGIAQTITGSDTARMQVLMEENVGARAGARARAVSSEQAVPPQMDTQTAVRMATGQLAGIAGVLAQTLYSPPTVDASPAIPPTHTTTLAHDGNDDGHQKEDDDGNDWRDKISKAKEAADRMVESANVLQNVSAPDTASWEAMKSYAIRAKEAAERAAKSIANATIQWKLTDEQRKEALCYRIAYPDWDSGERERGGQA